MSSQHSNSALRVGDRVKWFSDNGMPEYGTVRWIGILPDDTSTDLTVGVEFDKPIGIGTGKYKQHRLFTAKRGHASLIPLMGLVRADEEGTHPVRQQQYGHQASSDSGHSQSSDVTGLLRVGERVVWPSDRGLERGTVRWIGVLPDDDTDDIMAGVEFDNPVGTGTGKYKDYRLFYTKQDHASIIPLLGLVKDEEHKGHSQDANLEEEEEEHPVMPNIQVRPEQRPQPQQTGQPRARLSETSLQCYKMSAKPRGICIIVNNKDFVGVASLPTRHGTEFDKEKLEKTFTDLQFLVRCYDDVTDTDLMRLLQEMALEDHSRYDAFVCCILTHGALGVVYGVNGVPVEIRRLTEQLSAQLCPTLSGKPKLFILQACQGKKEMMGHPTFETDAQSVKEGPLVPDEADFLLAYSTVPGYVSYRSSTGSWFIGKLTDILNKHAHRFDVHDILTKVNDEVGSEGIPTPEGVKMQAPAILYSLRKKLYFRDN